MVFCSGKVMFNRFKTWNITILLKKNIQGFFLLKVFHNVLFLFVFWIFSGFFQQKSVPLTNKIRQQINESLRKNPSKLDTDHWEVAPSPKMFCKKRTVFVMISTRSHEKKQGSLNYQPQTMHFYKGIPSKLPYICSV